MKNRESKNDNRIIAIIGSWGTGKSTVKNILSKRISHPRIKPEDLKLDYKDQDVSFDNAEAIYKKFVITKNFLSNDKESAQNINSIVVTYEAMQFEESSQVTSELYNIIANTISKQNNSQFKWYDPTSAYRKFRSIAYLKKESFGSNISTTHILLLLKMIIFSMIGKLIIDAIIYVLKTSDPLFFITYFIKNVWGVNNQVFYSLLIYLPLTALILAKADTILLIITGFLARASHVDILKSISLDQPLFLLIDEIDRLSPEAVKLLFDEVLILKETWKNKQHDLTIFMFYDENVVLHQHKELHTYEPHIFLQKFYDEIYRLPKVHFDQALSTAIMMMLLPYGMRTYGNKHVYQNSQIKLPTIQIVNSIASYVTSFRNFEKLISYIYQHIDIPNITRYISQLEIDIFFICLSLKHFFDIKQIETQTLKNSIYYYYLEKLLTIIKQNYSFNNDIHNVEDYIIELIVKYMMTIEIASSNIKYNDQLLENIKTECRVLNNFQKDNYHTIQWKKFLMILRLLDKNFEILLSCKLSIILLSYIDWKHLGTLLSIGNNEIQESNLLIQFKDLKYISYLKQPFNRLDNIQPFDKIKNLLDNILRIVGIDSLNLVCLNDDYTISLELLKTNYKSGLYFIQFVLVALLKLKFVKNHQSHEHGFDIVLMELLSSHHRGIKKNSLFSETLNQTLLAVLYSEYSSYQHQPSYILEKHYEHFFSIITPQIKICAGVVFYANWISLYSFQYLNIILQNNHDIKIKLIDYLKQNISHKLLISLVFGALITGNIQTLKNWLELVMNENNNVHKILDTISQYEHQKLSFYELLNFCKSYRHDFSDYMGLR